MYANNNKKVNNYYVIINKCKKIWYKCSNNYKINKDKHNNKENKLKELHNRKYK